MGGETLSVEQCWALAQRWYEGRAEPDWEPWSRAEMAGIFRDVGLTGPFWELG